MEPGWPLCTPDRVFPDPPGRFGAERTYDIHTGIDLYCEPGTLVVAIEDGTVVAVEPFTGAWVLSDPSPWWNDTAVILVQGKTGVFAYGEVTPGSILVQAGDSVKAAQVLARVEVPVLRQFKGRPTVMLHLELYTGLPLQGSATVWWRRGAPCPPRLRDPTSVVEPRATSHFELQTYNGERYVVAPYRG